MVAVSGVSRTFGTGPAARHALRGVTFSIAAGQLVVLRGRSGSGKTTLLNIVGGLDAPDSGTVLVAGQDLTAMAEPERIRLRRRDVAYIFQTFGLIPILSAAENVGIPLRIGRVTPREREERVRHLLDRVGLADHTRQRPAELSGGQQQRVAIARALASTPRLLLADEPTSQLDSASGGQIIDLIRGIVDAEHLTALVATHDPAVAARADAVLILEDGQIAVAGPIAAPAQDGTAAELANRREPGR